MQKLELEMETVNKIYIILLLFIITSCDNSPIKYYHILGDGEKTIIQGEIENGLEDEEWSIATEEGKLVAIGIYRSGSKDGVWEYNVKDSTFKFHWQIYSNKDKGIRLNIPYDWKVIDHEAELFQATFNTRSKNKLNKYLLIGEYCNEDINLTYQDYITQSRKATLERSLILDEQIFKLSNGTKHSHFVRYILERDNEEILVFNLITVINNKIVDIGYSSLNENKDLKNFIFFEILLGCYIDNNRILNPFEPISFIPNGT